MSGRGSMAGGGEAAIDPLVWIGLASCAGALVLAAPLTTLATTALLAALLFKRTPVTAALAVVSLSLGTIRATWMTDRFEHAREAVVMAGGWPSRCTIAGRVARSPTVASGGLRVEIEDAIVRIRDGDAPPLTARVTLHVPAEVAMLAVPEMALSRGDEVSATASLAPPYRFWNIDDPRPSSARRKVLLSGGAEDLVRTRSGTGVRAWIDRTRARMRVRIVATFAPEIAPMARALVLGEDDLTDGDRRAFRKSGLAHLLAVSGMHLVLVVSGFVAALHACLVRMPAVAARLDPGRVASALGLPVAWIYADLAGGSGSAVRAAWMCSVVLLARALGRRPQAWRGLGLSMLAMSAIDPLVAFDVSFVLSALATLGIIALARPLETALRSRLPLRTPSFVVTPIATSAAATLTCAPVLASMAYELPLGGLVSNVVAIPLGEAAALPLCLAHAVLAFWPAAEAGSAIAASGALSVVRVIARAFTWGVLPVPPPTAAELGAMAGAFGAMALRRVFAGDRLTAARPGRVALLATIVIAALEIGARRAGAPRGTLRVTFLDVGQGDAALVDLPDGSAMLIDGGGLVGSPIDVGERAVAPVFAVRRRRELRAVVLSHPHPDHYLGLTSGLGGVTVAELWDTGQGEAEGTGGAYADLLTDLRRRGVLVRHPEDLCGTREVGGAFVDVLAPCPRIAADRGPNDNSFVLRIRYGARALLFVGDAEHEEEADLVRSLGSGLRADVLKIGHHGSRTSSTRPFLDAVSPSVAVISCGVRNRFGHPHPTTLASLLEAGIRVLRTDRNGSVVVSTDGTSLDVRAMTDELDSARGQSPTPQVRSTTPM